MLPQETIEQIFYLYSQDVDKSEIAEKLNVSQQDLDDCLSDFWYEIDLPGNVDEGWKKIEGFGDRYYVSTLGRVYSKGSSSGAPRILKPSKDAKGIAHVCFSCNGQVTGHLVHGLVADAFCGDRPEGAWVEFINGDVSDIRASNLRWKVRTWDEKTPKPSARQYVKEMGLTIPGEIWKPVSWAPTRYSVSNMGRIYTLGAKGVPPHLMKPQMNNRGYLLITLSMNNEKLHTTVHRLVAEAFCEGKSETCCDVNHIDGDKTNNVASNLEWVTKSENMVHARDVLQCIHHATALPSKRKFSDEQVRAIRADCRSIKAIADEYGVATRTIYLIRKRETYKDVA
jgi:hypothetical protein